MRDYEQRRLNMLVINEDILVITFVKNDCEIIN